MNKAIDAALIVGFLAVDYLFFHDVLKAGEVITLAEYLVGLLSVIVIVRAAHSLFEK